jgi:hypothetical protein
VNKQLGCETCSVSQSQLDLGLSGCFANCLNDPDCAIKSGVVDKLGVDKVRANLDQIISYGYLDSVAKTVYLDLLVAKNYTNLLVERGYTNILLQKNHKDLLIQNDWRLKLVYKDMADSKTALQTKLTQELANISEKLKSAEEKLDRKGEMLELIQSKFAKEKLVLDNEITRMKREINDLKKASQDRENAFNKQMNEVISKRLEEFKNELLNEGRL